MRWRVVPVVLVVAANVVLGGGGVAGATPSLPDDPAAKGTIGLCSRDGTPVTSGRTTDKPFVWRAVGSQRAPSPYDGDGATATLYGYQPRPSVPPDQWSGDTLTASSPYTNKAHPMAQATQLDFTLADLLNEYPPMSDGLVQLRLIVGAGQVGASPEYAAAVIQVSGQTWTVVSGSDQFSCTDGSATSSEVDAGVVDTAGNAVGTAAAALTASAAAASSAAAAGSPSGGGTTPTAAGVRATPTPSASTGTAARADTRGGSAVPWVVPALVVVAGGGAAVWWRRRHGAASHTGASQTTD